MFWCLRFLLLIVSAPIFAQEDHLTLSDINTQMKEVFRVHLTQKKMSPEVMQRAFANYINQFDPHHVYLAASDVAPFLQMSKEAQENQVENFNKEDYSGFDRLDLVIQASIKKMRKIRASLEVDEEGVKKIAKESLPVINQNEIGDINLFAQSEQQLETWFAIYLADLIIANVDNLKSLHKPISFTDATRDAEYFLEQHENDYLYLNKEGKPLDEAQKKSLFALRVLQAFTKSLDVHSQYLTPQQAKNMAAFLKKEYVGVGISFQELGNGFVVTSVAKGGSAEESGKVQVGDEIVGINSHAVAGMSFDSLLEQLQGKVDTTVNMTMKNKQNEIYTVFLTRKQLTIQEGRVETRFQPVPGGILGFIALHGFYMNDKGVSSEIDMRRAFEELKAKGTIKGLIFDLRDNPGGLLEQAVRVAGLFIKTGVIVVAKDARGGLHYYRDLDPAALYAGPLVVLISKETASAAEIVAQCLKDYGVAVIAGDPASYGKGTIQHTTDTKQITIGSYYSVSGHSIQKEGVQADIIVPGVVGENKIGEAFEKGAFNPDFIAPSFIDSLRDVSIFERLLYQRRYRPYIQQQTEVYRKWIPMLAARSKERIKNNRSYQNLLNNKLQIIEGKGKVEKVVLLTPEQAQKVLKELQEQEATYITLDLMNYVGGSLY
ncbi:MAG: PDZ domain-containing protein [Chlamydiales bacterium]|nr:PDZ domain-containing protein [Chlamydiales bacterium]